MEYSTVWATGVAWSVHPCALGSSLDCEKALRCRVAVGALQTGPGLRQVEKVRWTQYCVDQGYTLVCGPLCAWTHLSCKEALWCRGVMRAPQIGAGLWRMRKNFLRLRK